jgi:histidine triad (HIT) family protein
MLYFNESLIENCYNKSKEIIFEKGDVIMVDHSCVFCKIVKGEIPSKKVYEDDNFLVILDISPASKGHVIIIPKDHKENIYEITEEDASKVMSIAKKVAIALEKVLQCDGLNIVQNNGVIAGQTVFHFHVHVIPRYKNDNVKIGWIPGEIKEEKVEKFMELVKKELV